MHNKQLLIDILSVQSETYNSIDMENFIMDRLDDMRLDYTIDGGNIYVSKGQADSYPCIVSHMDTVHKIIPQDRYRVMHDDYCAMGFDRGLNAPTGCGGDDKVGIFVCLTMLEQLDNVKVVFFRDEEIGCLGSSDAYIPFFDDARFILQCDRKGNKDFVNNIFGLELQSSAFSADVLTIIKNHGYSFSDGGMTDVYQLALDGVGVSVANMSCGYYNPHSDDETVVFDDVSNCMSMVYEIMSTMTDIYKHKADRSYGYGTGSYGGYGGYNINNYADDSWGSYDSWLGLSDKSNNKKLDEKHFCCEDCGYVTEIDSAEYIQDFNAIVCKQCFDRYEEDIFTAQTHVEDNQKKKKSALDIVKQTFMW